MLAHKISMRERDKFKNMLITCMKMWNAKYSFKYS